jgi:hypothetical protein
MAPNIVEATPLQPEPEKQYDENGVLVAVPTPTEITQERDGQIKKLEEDIAVAQFRSLLKSKAARERAHKILPQFQKGTLTVEHWGLLDTEHKKLYLMLHGTVEIPGMGIAKATRRFTAPMTDGQRVVLRKKRAKRDVHNKLAKASRKRNRK